MGTTSRGGSGSTPVHLVFSVSVVTSVVSLRRSYFAYNLSDTPRSSCSSQRKFSVIATKLLSVTEEFLILPNKKFLPV